MKTLLLLHLFTGIIGSQVLQGNFVPRSHGRMKTSTAKPYSSFLLTTPATTGSSETTSRSDSAKNSKKSDDVDGEEDEVYILYGVLFNNGSEPMIASNITDSQVVEQVRSKLALLANHEEKNVEDDRISKKEEKFGHDGRRSNNGVGEIIVGKRRKEELIMSRVDHNKKPSKAPNYYPVKVKDSAKPNIKISPPVTQPLKLGNSPTTPRPGDKKTEEAAMPVRQKVKLGALVKQLLKYPVKPRTNQAVELPPLTEQLFNISRSEELQRNDEEAASVEKKSNENANIGKVAENSFNKEENVGGDRLANNLQKNFELAVTNNRVHSSDSFGHEKEVFADEKRVFVHKNWVHEETPSGRGSNNPEFAEKITKAIFPPNITPGAVPTRGSVIEGMSGPKLNRVRTNQKMDSGENAEFGQTLAKDVGQAKSDQDLDLVLVYPVSEKPVYFRPKASGSKFVEVQPVYIGPHGAAVHGKYQFEEEDARGTTPETPKSTSEDPFEKPFLETNTWEVYWDPEYNTWYYFNKNSGSSVWEKPPELSFVDLAAPVKEATDIKVASPDLNDLVPLLDPPDHLLPAVLPRPTMPPPPQGLEQQVGATVSRPVAPPVQYHLPPFVSLVGREHSPVAIQARNKSPHNVKSMRRVEENVSPEELSFDDIVTKTWKNAMGGWNLGKRAEQETEGLTRAEKRRKEKRKKRKKNPIFEMMVNMATKGATKYVMNKLGLEHSKRRDEKKKREKKFNPFKVLWGLGESSETEDSEGKDEKKKKEKKEDDDDDEPSEKKESAIMTLDLDQLL